MTIAYSSNLGLISITTGTESGLWGTYTNTNICSLIEQAISGYATQAIPDADTTVNITNGSTSAGRNAALKLTGALTQIRSLIVPTVQKLYYINNATTGGFAVTVRTASGTGVSVPNGKAMVVLADGTNVVEAVTYISGVATSANPSASIGLTAVNGTAATFMTSDSAPALSHSITPTWTGAHIWSASATFNSTASFTGTVTFTSTTNPTINDGAGSQYAVGFRGLPQNAKTGAYVAVATDAGKSIPITTGGVTVNASVFSAGDAFTIYNNSGSSQTVTAGASVTFRLAGTATTGNRTLAQYGIMTLLCITGGATPTFVCMGPGVS